MEEAFRIGFPVFVAVLVVAGLAALVSLTARNRRADTSTPQEWGRRRGWRIAPQSRAAWMARLPGHAAEGVLGLTLDGEFDGRRVTVAEHEYRLRTGSGSTLTTVTYHCVAVVVAMPHPYPPVAVTDRTEFMRLGTAPFGDDPVATGHAGFDGRFVVTAVDPHSARMLLSPELIEAHLAGEVPRWSVAGRELITYRPGRLDTGGDIPDLVTPILRVAKLLEQRA